ncbi:RNA-guided endonuclease InsQ/TnpB family protein [Lactobacillus helveticus]|uniref:RNA-guided endonuclease InsQ/TnpB family protein n=7 Tax=Lactobacillus helveticus TaxID=1587 RepID=UPI00081A67A5|nr:RNA-guided endonuclease TnpB family protein [Lactobacillus helveticus]ANZ56614.1 transposase [Lactobacillus helveticus]AQY53064.1 transposase [Lactobacillus helveticus]URN36684.1 transposase [Lactobacillus helveticus]
MKRMSSLAYHFGIKLRFYPSSKQKKIIKLNYDAQRFVYNSYAGRNRTNYHARRFLAINQGQAMPFAFPILNDYEAKLAETVVANDELLAKPKNIRDAYSFLRVKEIDSLALANAIQNYRKAWNHYRKIGHGIPTFHKKRSDWSYQTNCQYPKQKEAYLDNGTAKFIDAKHIKLPKLGVIRIAGLRKLIKERLLKHVSTRIGTVTIKKTAGDQFYLSMQLGSDIAFAQKLPKTQSQIGIDLNLDNFLTDSNGAMVAKPRFYRNAKKKLAHAQRVLSRRQREDFLQVLSTALIKNHDLVVAEELRSKNLLKNHALSQAISDVGWRRFLNMLAYKAKLYDKEFQTIDPKYTTQRCHNCGTIMGQNGCRKLKLKDREWTCPMCQTYHIRDWNAAVNILEKGLGSWQNPKKQTA